MKYTSAVVCLLVIGGIVPSAQGAVQSCQQLAQLSLPDEMVPPANRGNEVDSILESMGCAEGRVQEYENVWIGHYSDVCLPLKPERESRATVVFKRQSCPTSTYALIHK